jgi:uncharacterized membrane protein
MFKTSYHVYVILPAMAVVCYVGTIKRLQFRASRLAFSLFGAMCLMPGLIYPWFGISQLLGTSPPLLRLSGLDFMQQKGSGESEAREFLIAHRPPPGFALLEASGDSYTYAGRMSATTGIPTILGWHAHEWLWRNSLDPWRTRADAIAQFYESSNDDDRQAFIKTYHIYYIVIGVQERSRYPHLDYSGLQRLGRIVFSGDGTEIIQVLR